jgi:hypothetical protein
LAYVSKETITKARAALKALNKEYGVKATFSGKGDSTLFLTIAEGKIDFVNNYCETIAAKRIHRDVEQTIGWAKLEQRVNVNHYYLEDAFSGKALEYMQKAKEIMYADHWDKSDSQSDYFHCAYYIGMSVGKYDKAYKFVN